MKKKVAFYLSDEEYQYISMKAQEKHWIRRIPSDFKMKQDY